MKHPVRSEFDTAVTEVGVTVTFKPTNSIYSFYRLADTDDIARLGPVWLARAQHAGPSGDTNDYPADEVLEMSERIAKESRLMHRSKARRLQAFSPDFLHNLKISCHYESLLTRHEPENVRLNQMGDECAFSFSVFC